MLKIVASLKILALEDQEQGARPLDFWEPTASGDSDQSDGEQPVPAAGSATRDTCNPSLRL